MPSTNNPNSAKTGLTACACSLIVLVYEILLSRIFSVLFGYDTLFIIISLAILGLGLGGIFLNWYKGNTTVNSDLIGLAFSGLGLSLLTGVIVFSRLFPILGIYGCAIISLLPFFLAGIILAGLYQIRPEQSGLTYWADLSGGALGCLASFPLVQYLGVHESLVFISFLAGLFGLLFHGRRHKNVAQTFRSATGVAGLKPRATTSSGESQQRDVAFYGFGLGTNRNTQALALAVPVTSLIILIYSFFQPLFNLGPDQLRQSKTPLGILLSHPRIKSNWLRSTWDVYSRCDLVELPRQPDRKRIFINGASEAIMMRPASDTAQLKRELAYFPYQMGSNERVLVIGSGGGKDVYLARRAGAKKITAVEINQAVVNMTEQEREFNGDIYRQPGVNLVVEDGRRFIMQDKQSYDRIVLNLAYSYAFADLSSISQMENYLFTQEAFDQYFNHLNDDGTLTIFIDYPELLVKFLFSCLQHFKEKGIDHTQAMNHVIVLSKNYWPETFYALLVRKTPYPADTNLKMTLLLAENPVETNYLPGQPGRELFHRLAAGKTTPQESIGQSTFQLTPATDNQPFFLEVVLNYRRKLIIFALLILVITGIAGAVYFLPRSSNTTGGGYFPVYFALVGMGFMLIEIALTKRFSFYLGYPQLNLSVVLAFLLLACGCGGYLSGRLKLTHSQISRICFILGSLVLITMSGLNPFLNHTIAYGLPLRIILLWLYLLPVGLLMGMPFPLGLKLAARQGLTGQIPRLWGLNALATVLGSVVSVILAMLLGFTYVFYLAALCYLIAGGCIIMGGRNN
ncbi:MAG: hypothetical protein HZA78_04835 [Candidatus Schekmanbacteria bacterium]|nr:hypothetical protein [Candidatus Schekmanbacteria bacterium]